MTPFIPVLYAMRDLNRPPECSQNKKGCCDRSKSGSPATFPDHIQSSKACLSVFDPNPASESIKHSQTALRKSTVKSNQMSLATAGEKRS
eukprot:571387-Amphidinium_carterae.1